MRKPWLRALWRKFFPKDKPASHPSRPKPRQTRGIEPLEGRIAPATLLDASTLLYKDPEGDMVTVKFSKAIFDPAAPALNATLDQVFIFSTGDAHSGTDSAQQLQLIDLSKAPVINFENVAAGASLSIVAVKAGGNGDDLADIGAIKAGANALGRVVVDGDLGQIDCGNSSTKIGLKSLQLQTFGAKGLTTQTAVTGTGTVGETERAEKLESKITGALGTLTVAHDMQGFLHVVNGTQFNGSQSVISAPGKVGQITIGGALKGQFAVESASNNTGSIDAASTIRKVTVGVGGSNDGIIGGGGINSGALISGDKIRSVIISGAVLGGAGSGSGRISAGGDFDTVKISGTLTGGDGDNSGVVHSGGALKKLLVGNSLVAGKGARSGVISTDGLIRAATITGAINGDVVDAGIQSGGISASGNIDRVTLAGALMGGAETLTGFIESQSDIKTVVINGNVIGGAGVSSATVSSAGSLASITIRGTVTGGGGDNSGAIFSGLDSATHGGLGKINIVDSLHGGAGSNSGSIIAEGGISSASIGMSAGAGHIALAGGSGAFSGTIYSNAEVGSVKLLGVAMGGAGAHSGSVESMGAMRTVEMEGLSGGKGDFSGSIVANDRIDRGGEQPGNIQRIAIRGIVAGGEGFRAGSVAVDGSLGTALLGALNNAPGSSGGGFFTGLGAVGPGNAHKIIVAGAVDGTSIRIGDAIGSLSVGTLNNSVISARGGSSQENGTDRAIGGITVHGAVTNSQILAGYDLSGVGVNRDAQIGSVTVHGSWTASALAAGVADVGGNGFGNEDDRPIVGIDNPNIVSRIAAIRIDGTVTGTSSPNDHFGFVAQQIDAFSRTGNPLPLNKQGVDVEELDLANGDVSLREVSST